MLICLVQLPEQRRIYARQMSIRIKYKLPKNYVELVYDEKVSRHFWRIAMVTEVLPSRDFETKKSDSDN